MRSDARSVRQLSPQCRRRYEARSSRSWSTQNRSTSARTPMTTLTTHMTPWSSLRTTTSFELRPSRLPPPKEISTAACVHGAVAGRPPRRPVRATPEHFCEVGLSGRRSGSQPVAVSQCPARPASLPTSDQGKARTAGHRSAWRAKYHLAEPRWRGATASGRRTTRLQLQHSPAPR